MTLEFAYKDDLDLVKHLRGLSYADVARGCGLSEKTLKRWASGTAKPNAQNLAAFYDYAYNLGISLNQMKSQFHKEALGSQGKIVLFHGSRTAIQGNLSLERCNPGSDFGRGFYCGESLDQAELFVSGFPNLSVYIAGLDSKGLRCERYAVDQDWMLTIAVFRGRLADYADHPRIRGLVGRVHAADYVIAPIADNRMYEIISEFIDGITTDVVCEHCLSATQLGNQYVFLTPKALDNLKLVERCFISQGERGRCSQQRKSDLRAAEDKVKAAKRLYRGQGLYIDELLS